MINVKAEFSLRSQLFSVVLASSNGQHLQSTYCMYVTYSLSFNPDNDSMK